MNDCIERVQLKVLAIAALVPPRPINTALLNHTVKRLQVRQISLAFEIDKSGLSYK